MDKELDRSILSLRVRCSLGCQWIGELRHLERHLSPAKEGDCPLVEVKCDHGCGHTMKRQERVEHEEEVCSKRPLEFQLLKLQSGMEKMWAELKQQHKAEIDLLKERLKLQEEEITKMREDINKLKESKDPFSTTIPVFSPSILLIMPKLPNGNIPGVSYYPSDRFVKIIGSCKEELEARTHQFLAEYEKIIPRLLKESFAVNLYFPEDVLKTLIDGCNKKFNACYITSMHEPTHTIEVLSTNGSQFQLVKKYINDKLNEKIHQLRFHGDVECTFTMKMSDIHEEIVDVIVLTIGASSPSVPPVTGSINLGSFLKSLSSGESGKDVPSFIPSGEVVVGKNSHYKSKHVIYIPSLSPHTSHGYFGKESYAQLSLSVNQAFQEAVKLDARSIAFPSEITSGNMQSNYVIPAVIKGFYHLTGMDNTNGQTDTSQVDKLGGVASVNGCSLRDVRILIQDDRLDANTFTGYCKYLATKFNLH